MCHLCVLLFIMLNVLWTISYSPQALSVCVKSTTCVRKFQENVSIINFATFAGSFYRTVLKIKSNTNMREKRTSINLQNRSSCYNILQSTYKRDPALQFYGRIFFLQSTKLA
uniref:Secreted protein n=1 Tax=Cacopsylla melanoneura TaxID=428564 RepID=A0A8D9B4I0_9HEMI